MAYEDMQAQAQDVQDKAASSEAQEENSPVDLAQAFQMLRQGNKEAAQPPAEEGTGGEASDDAGVQREEEVGSGAGDAGYQPETSAEPAVAEVTAGNGGPAVAEPGYDYSAIRQGIIEDIKRQAQQNMLRKFKENPSGEIRLMDIGDIYERRQDGTVVFHNPDDPNNPFRSRSDAQAWIDSMNGQIRQGYQRGVFEEEQRLLQLAQPAIRLMEFAPTYEMMDATTQAVFDQLIDPYAVFNEQGKVIGYNCNLNAMGQQAANIVSKFVPETTKAPEAQQQTKQTEPAMDMKTGANQDAGDAEPKTIEDAWKIINKQKRSN